MGVGGKVIMLDLFVAIYLFVEVVFRKIMIGKKAKIDEGVCYADFGRLCTNALSL